MSPTELRSARPGGPELSKREPESRRAVAARRRRMRLRRTLVCAMALLLCGTAAARWAEDPGDAVATGAAGGLPEAGSTTNGAAPPVGVVAGPASATAPVATSTGPAAATALAPSATVRADDDSEEDRSPASGTSPSPQVGPAAGAGTISPVAIPNGPVEATGRTVRYSIEVEDGLQVSSAEFANLVHSVLTDQRGWQTKDSLRFVPVSPAEVTSGADVDIRITLGSPSLTAKLCAPLDITDQQVSCWNGGRSVLNLARWMLGARTYGSDLNAYRVYLVNHEVGHGLGHQHVTCPAAGNPAPVMVQQTKSLEGCTAWPFPVGA